MTTASAAAFGHPSRDNNSKDATRSSLPALPTTREAVEEDDALLAEVQSIFDPVPTLPNVPKSS